VIEPLPAIVPAAGASLRMGRPKLTLPLADGSVVIGRVLDALRRGGASPIVVVGPPRSAAGWAQLADACELPGVSLCIPDVPTADMRESLGLGLAALEAWAEGFLLTPADSVGITPAVVAAVLDQFRADPSRIVIPRHGGRRGHPVAFPRDLIAALEALPPGTGPNALRQLFPDRVVLVDVEEVGTLVDLDTPEDYEKFRP